MMEIYVIILFSVSILLVFIHSLTRASGHEVSVERERISSLATIQCSQGEWLRSTNQRLPLQVASKWELDHVEKIVSDHGHFIARINEALQKKKK